MYSVVGYVTKPITGKKLTTEVLLSLNNRELYEIIDILFSKFRNYWIPKNSDIWLDGGHPVGEKANKIYIFHEELNILDGFDASTYTVEDLRQEIEEFLSMGAPQ